MSPPSNDTLNLEHVKRTKFLLTGNDARTGPLKPLDRIRQGASLGEEVGSREAGSARKTAGDWSIIALRDNWLDPTQTHGQDAFRYLQEDLLMRTAREEAE